MIAATVEHNGRELTAELTVNAVGTNKARINTAPARRPRELIRILRSVMFAPEDLLLVRGDPETAGVSSMSLSHNKVRAGSPPVPTTTRCCVSARHCSRPQVRSCDVVAATRRR